MPDDYQNYRREDKIFTPGRQRHLGETLEGEIPSEIYRTTLVDDNDRKYTVNVTAEWDGRLIITEKDSRYGEEDTLYIDVPGYNVQIRTNKIPDELRGGLDPDQSDRDQVKESKYKLMTEAVERFLVGVNYKVGVGEVTEEEKREYEEGVPYNRKQVLEDLLKIIIILGSGLSLLWILSSQRITAKFVSAMGLASNIVYGLLTFIFLLGLILFLRRNKL